MGAKCSATIVTLLNKVEHHKALNMLVFHDGAVLFHLRGINSPPVCPHPCLGTCAAFPGF